MKKYIILPILLAGLTACKQKDSTKDEKLEVLIKNKDVKGLQAYKDRQKYKLDSLNGVLNNIDSNLTKLGVSPAASGTVSVQKMAVGSFVHNVEIQGNVTTDQDVMVQPQFAGVLSLFVKKGQTVRQGQLIGRVADGGLNDQYKQAQIQVSTVKSQLAQLQSQVNLNRIAFEKQSALWRQKIGSEFQYLQAKAVYEGSLKQIAAAQSNIAAAQSAANALNARLATTAITAPFSGVVDQVVTQNGQVVAPGTNIVKLISLGMMRVEANVPETYLAKVRQGTSVKVFIPTLNKTLSSTIRLVGNYIDPQTRTFKIEIPISGMDGAIKPNLMAQIKIEDYINPNGLSVPAQYIYDDASHKSYVFVAENINGADAVARKVYVTAGEKSDNSVEIASGLKAGDMVITDGSKSLTDGQKIKISQ